MTNDSWLVRFMRLAADDPAGRSLLGTATVYLSKIILLLIAVGLGLLSFRMYLAAVNPWHSRVVVHVGPMLATTGLDGPHAYINFPAHVLLVPAFFVIMILAVGCAWFLRWFPPREG